MARNTITGRVILDWRRLLGFDQATDGAASATALHPKIGPKDALSLNANCTLGAKIGPKEARGFGRPATRLGAKIGQKDPVLRSTRSLGRNLVAKVGQKETVRSGVCLPLSVTAKIGKKEN